VSPQLSGKFILNEERFTWARRLLVADRPNPRPVPTPGRGPLRAAALCADSESSRVKGPAPNARPVMHPGSRRRDQVPARVLDVRRPPFRAKLSANQLQPKRANGARGSSERTRIMMRRRGHVVGIRDEPRRARFAHQKGLNAPYSVCLNACKSQRDSIVYGSEMLVPAAVTVAIWICAERACRSARSSTNGAGAWCSWVLDYQMAPR
jgi:hypothetical protein